jgi:hypothetical protein
MSPYLSHKRSGAPTYTEISASLSLSGLEDFSPLDPNPLDAAEWYQHPGSEHHHSYDFPPLSPGHDHFATTGFGPGGFASHGITVTSAEMHRKPFSPLSVVHVSPFVSPFCRVPQRPFLVFISSYARFSAFISSAPLSCVFPAHRALLGARLRETKVQMSS